MTDLGTLGGKTSRALGVNGLGQVVGEAQFHGTDHHAVLWQNGKVTDLGTLGGPISSASSINGLGQIAGGSRTSDGSPATHAFLWQSGKMTDLGTLGGPNSAALCVSNTGQVAGFACLSGGDRHGALWQGNKVTDLGTLGGRNSVAHAVSVTGLAVGMSWLPDGSQHACAWQGTRITDLDPMDSPDSCADAVNARGQVVGRAQMPNGDDHAFVCQGGAVSDLNGLIPADAGWLLQEAKAISDAGGIVGVGIHNGVEHAFLLVPVPPAGVQDVTAQVQVTRSGMVYNPATKSFQQTLTLRNASGAALGGPLGLVINGLPAGAAWSNASGAYQGSPYAVAAPAGLAAGASVQVPVRLSDPSQATVNYYTTQVLTGTV